MAHVLFGTFYMDLFVFTKYVTQTLQEMYAISFKRRGDGRGWFIILML